MPRKKSNEPLSDEEAERRATDALRRALTTPYKPQKDMVGKLGRDAKKTPDPARKSK
jgi:hypothetical protein